MDGEEGCGRILEDNISKSENRVVIVDFFLRTIKLKFVWEQVLKVWIIKGDQKVVEKLTKWIYFH